MPRRGHGRGAPIDVLTRVEALLRERPARAREADQGPARGGVRQDGRAVPDAAAREQPAAAPTRPRKKATTSSRQHPPPGRRTAQQARRRRHRQPPAATYRTFRYFAVSALGAPPDYVARKVDGRGVHRFASTSPSCGCSASAGSVSVDPDPPVTDFGALYYTDCEPAGLLGGAGFQFQRRRRRAGESAAPDAARGALRAAGGVDAAAPAGREYPRSLAHAVEDGLYLTAAGCYLGLEANRPRKGNQFTHAVVKGQGKLRLAASAAVAAPWWPSGLRRARASTARRPAHRTLTVPRFAMRSPAHPTAGVAHRPGLALHARIDGGPPILRRQRSRRATC